MRARNLKPSLFKNEELADLGPYAVLLFQGLWCLADREGRLEDRPRRIKAEIIPYWDVDVDSTLQALNEYGFIMRYSIAEHSYIQITNFSKHQHPNIKEADSTIPAPPKHSTSTVQALDGHALSFPPYPLPLTELKESELDSSTDAPSSNFKFEQRHRDIAAELAENISDNNPREKPPTDRQIEDWANTARLMEQRDGRDMDEMYQIMRWSQQDSFWRKNIKSMGKFREKYARLWEQMSDPVQSRASPQPTPLRPKSYDNDLSKRRMENT